MRSVCVRVCVCLSLSLSLLFGALQRPRIGNSHVLLCLSFSTFTLLGPTSFMLHGVQIFVCIFDVHFFGLRLHFLHFRFALFYVVFLHFFFCIVYLCFLHCVFAIALLLHFYFYFYIVFLPLHFFCIFHLLFLCIVFLPLHFFCIFHLLFFCITCCIFSRLQFSRISPEGANTITQYSNLPVLTYFAAHAHI